MNRIVVSPVSEFPPGERRILRVDGREIGVFRIDDEFYAIRNRCPHQGAPVCLGAIVPRVVAAQPGDARVVEGTPFLACPWHGWEYDLATGQSFMGPAEVGVVTYAVTVEPGSAVRAELGDTAAAERVPGPYVAETFSVYVENDYVVLEA